MRCAACIRGWKSRSAADVWCLRKFGMVAWVRYTAFGISRLGNLLFVEKKTTVRRVRLMMLCSVAVFFARGGGIRGRPIVGQCTITEDIICLGSVGCLGQS